MVKENYTFDKEEAYRHLTIVRDSRDEDVRNEAILRMYAESIGMNPSDFVPITDVKDLTVHLK